MMPPLAWLPTALADAMGLAIGLALIGWERRVRQAGPAPHGVASSPTAHH
jgi:hypothetical protein